MFADARKAQKARSKKMSTELAYSSQFIQPRLPPYLLAGNSNITEKTVVSCPYVMCVARIARCVREM